MAKEDKKVKLDPGQYWEWRTTISELQCAEHRRSNSDLTLKVLTQNAEICALKVEVFKRTIYKSSHDAVDAAKKEYDETKKRLEEKLGTSLNSKMIDDVTFEVKDLPKSTTQ